LSFYDALRDANSQEERALRPGALRMNGGQPASIQHAWPFIAIAIPTDSLLIPDAAQKDCLLKRRSHNTDQIIF
jgi:hypothetical protein